MQETWLDTVHQLSKEYPVADPSLALAIDDGVEKMLDIAGGARDEPLANPLYVESLLADCVGRVSNCLTIREKANDIQERAVFAALSYISQRQSIATQSRLAEILDTLAPTMLQNATSVSYAGGTATFSCDSPLWKDDPKATGDQKTGITVRKELEKVLNDKNETLKQKSDVPGDASNYKERFAFLKALFDQELKEAYRRAIVVKKALKDIYQITATDLPDTKGTGFLDRFALWAQHTSAELDRELDGRYLGSICFALATADDASPIDYYHLMARPNYTTQMNASVVGAPKLDFKLSSDHFKSSGMDNILLRSIKIQMEPADATKIKNWHVVVRLPPKPVTNDREEQVALVASTALADGSSPDSAVRGVHNIEPYGEWSLRFADLKSLSGEVISSTSVPNIYVVLTVSYRRAKQ